MKHFTILLFTFFILLTLPDISTGAPADALKSTIKDKKKFPKKVIDRSPIQASSEMHSDPVIPDCNLKQDLIDEVMLARKNKGFNPFGIFSKNKKIIDIKSGEYKKSNLSIGEAKDIETRRIETNNLITNQPLQDYANAILECLKKASGVNNVPGSVYITLTDDYFAQSSADGNIFISPAWFTTDTSTESVIAMLLAHELAHVLLHHHELTMIKRLQNQLQYFWTVGASLRNKLEERKEKDNLTPQQYKEVQKMQLIIEASENILLPIIQREQEVDADALGFDLFRLAGYENADAANVFLGCLGATEKKAAEQRAQELATIEQQNTILVSDGKLGDALKLGISDALKTIKQSLAETHPDSAFRETSLGKYRAETWKRKKKPEKSKEPSADASSAENNNPVSGSQTDATKMAQSGTAPTMTTAAHSGAAAGTTTVALSSAPAITTTTAPLPLPATKSARNSLIKLKQHKDVDILTKEVNLFSAGYSSLKEKNFAEAQLILARLAQGKILSRNAHVIFSYYLTKKHLNQKDAHEVLKGAFQAQDQAWKPYAEYARQSHSVHDKDKTIAFLKNAHEKFRNSPALLPKLIALYAEFGMTDEVGKLVSQCLSQNEAVDYKKPCLKAREIKPNPGYMEIFNSNIQS